MHWLLIGKGALSVLIHSPVFILKFYMSSWKIHFPMIQNLFKWWWWWYCLISFQPLSCHCFTILYTFWGEKNMFSFKEYFSEFFRHEGRRCIWGIVHNTSNSFYCRSNPFTNLLSKSAKSEFFFSEDRFWSIGKTSLIKHEELDQFMKLTIKSWKLLSYHENNHQIMKITSWKLS